MSRTEILNYLIENFGYRSYLELGVNDGVNFEAIKATGLKVGVDPKGPPATHEMTSDEYFQKSHRMFDLIFVDGLHEWQQCYDDIIDSLARLNDNGTIVVHDCNPQSYLDQLVPRIQSRWNGDVWKAWVKLRAERSDLEMFVLDTDEGCGVIRKGKQKAITLPENPTYQGLEDNRIKWLNLKPKEWISQLT